MKTLSYRSDQRHAGLGSTRKPWISPLKAVCRKAEKFGFNRHRARVKVSERLLAARMALSLRDIWGKFTRSGAMYKGG
jgi:hypothetical protein